MKKSEFGNITYESADETSVRQQFVETFKQCPIPDSELLSNLGLFLNSKTLSRILFMNHLYQQIVDVQGIVIEFGCRWGQNSSLFAALRGIYEPFNRHRKIVGFDTFKGFPGITEKDGKSKLMRTGGDTVSKGYLKYLNTVLELQEKDNPLSHIKKFEIVPGDATVELEKYLAAHPETIIALAYFDFDLYAPTRKCLDVVRPYLVKGSVLGFDELNDPDSPGETVALREVFDLNKIPLKRFRYTSRVSYFVIE
jgi:hypothetical protein